MNAFRIRFTRIEDGRYIELRLISHYTCIYGDDSGEGKTEFISILEEGMNDSSIMVDSPFPFAIASPGNIEALMSNDERQILLLDESLVLRDELIKLAHESHHIFICITRATPLKNDYPLRGIYHISRTSDDWFSITTDDTFKFAGVDFVFDRIITEAADGASENELLSEYFDEIKGAAGRNRIEQLLRNTTDKILVFVDLGNIGSAYAILKKRQIQNPNIRFYDYLSFEHLLYESPLVQKISNVNNVDIFDYMSLERYYTEMLEKTTVGTDMEYTHGEPLADRFLHPKTLEELFDSPVGRTLLGYVIREKTKQ